MEICSTNQEIVDSESIHNDQVFFILDVDRYGLLKNYLTIK